MDTEKKIEPIEDENIMEWEVDGLTEKEAREVRILLSRFLKKYKENQDREIIDWLSEQLQEELPDKTDKEIYEIAKEIKESIEEYDKDLKDLNDSCKKGVSKESWLSRKLQDSAKGIEINKFGNSLGEIDKSLTQANLQMERTVMKGDGVKQCLNLDGFIAEQKHVNDFNALAELEGSPYRARVCGPENGGYAKNSVDVVIDNIKTGQKSVERYQMKYGKDAQATIRLLKKGNYQNQRLVVPKEQVAEVQKAFPNKTVVAHIGGNDKIKTSSRDLTKKQVKELQNQAQEQGVLLTLDWNTYQTKELALNIGKQAGKAGVQAAFLGIGFNLAHKAFSGEEIEADEVVKDAIETGSDTCVKAAAGGALKAASEKGVVSIIPPGTPAGTITKIACVGIENVKILWKVAKGELTMSEAMEHMGRTSVSVYAGLSAAAVGTGIGMMALSWIPIAGPLVGGLIGGTVGYMAGSKVGEKVFNGAKKVVKKGVEIVKKGVEVVKDVAVGIKNFLFGWL